MLIKTLLNKVERFKSFVYGDSRLTTVNGEDALIIDIKPRRNSKPECPECQVLKDTHFISFISPAAV